MSIDSLNHDHQNHIKLCCQRSKNLNKMRIKATEKEGTCKEGEVAMVEPSTKPIIHIQDWVETGPCCTLPKNPALGTNICWQKRVYLTHILTKWENITPASFSLPPQIKSGLG